MRFLSFGDGYIAWFTARAFHGDGWGPSSQPGFVAKPRAGRSPRAHQRAQAAYAHQRPKAGDQKWRIIETVDTWLMLVTSLNGIMHGYYWIIIGNITQCFINGYGWSYSFNSCYQQPTIGYQHRHQLLWLEKSAKINRSTTGQATLEWMTRWHCDWCFQPTLRPPV